MAKKSFPQYPRVTTKNFVSWNEEMFKKYNNERVYEHQNPIIRFVERKRVEKILKFLTPVKKTDYILAAGCGEGYIEKKIPSAKVLLVDISKEAIKRSQVSLKKNKRYTFLQANLEKLPMKANTFDKIECSEVIEHVLSPKKILEEFHRVLKVDGILVISYPNEPLINTVKKIFIRLGLFYYLFPNIPKDMTQEWHLRAYNYKQFKSDIENNWEILSKNGVPFNIFPLRYVTKCKKVI